MKTITDVDYKNLLIQKKSVIDVRASVEFLQGSFPNAVNLPILNDEERALVGTVYKQKGNAEAVIAGASGRRSPSVRCVEHGARRQRVQAQHRTRRAQSVGRRGDQFELPHQ